MNTFAILVTFSKLFWLQHLIKNNKKSATTSIACCPTPKKPYIAKDYLQALHFVGHSFGEFAVNTAQGPHHDTKSMAVKFITCNHLATTCMHCVYFISDFLFVVPGIARVCVWSITWQDCVSGWLSVIEYAISLHGLALQKQIFGTKIV